MDDHATPHHREEPATYRRRRVVAGAASLALVALLVLLASRLSGEVEPPAGPSASAETTGTAADPAPAVSGEVNDDDAGGSTTTTAFEIPGFASPQDYLACVKERESRGDYAAESPDGQFFGAYQIDQVTWNNTAQHAGLLGVYAVQPNLAAPADQDALAMALLEWQGTTPWAGDC